MQRKNGSTLFAALSAAVLLLAATPARTQGLVRIGSGTYPSPTTATTS